MKELTDKKELKQTNGLEPMPKNEEAEIALLGSILLEGDEIFEKAKAIIKEPKCFYTTKHQELWKSFHRLYKNNVPIDTVTVFGDLKIKQSSDSEIVHSFRLTFDVIPEII